MPARRPPARLDAHQLALPLFDAPAAAVPTQATSPSAPAGHARRERDEPAPAGADPMRYRLRRARRRTIGFQIDDDGLTVSAPRWVTLREIEAAIAEKDRWIRTKLAQWRDWAAKRRLAQVRWVDGETLPYLGAPLVMRLRADAGSTRLAGDTAAATLSPGPADPAAGAAATVPGGPAPELLIALPADAQAAQVRDAVQSWLQAEARRVFAERIALLAPRSRAPLRGWTLSSARTQWGSCTHDGRVRLNWRLVHFSVAVIDYVIAHELAHLSEMNHSQRFWRTVGELLPGFEAARDEIKGVDVAALPL